MLLKRTLILFFIIVTMIICSFHFPAVAETEKEVFIISVDGPIGPVSAHYIERALKKANKEDAMCLVIQIDTPGGLMDSMKEIMQDIINSDVPVIVFVSPRGASATSAGVFITLSAHIAVMAPNTNIGAAHPVMVGQDGEQPMSDEMKDKITNDSVALLKTTAEGKGRNVEWAEKAVRESVSATENEALKLKVVDMICDDIDDLLATVDGMEVETVDGKRILQTKNAPRLEIPMTSSENFLDVLSNPNIAYILIILGTYGLIYELANPLSIFPGVVGGICMILAFFALGTLPVNYAGLALIIFSFLLFIIDIKAPSHGILTAGGIISLILGSIFLFNTDVPYYRVSPLLIATVVLTTVIFFLVIIALCIRTFKNKVTTGQEGLIGLTGKVKVPLEPQGQILVRGELWKAVTQGRYIKKDEEAVIKKVEGLTVYVDPPEKSE